jgi:hypothetical protein
MRLLLQLTTTAVAFSICCLSESVAQDIFSTQSLYQNCKAPDGSPRAAICLGFISGIGSMMQLIGTVEQKHPEKDYGVLAICGNPSNGAMVQAFKNWVEKNPQEWATEQTAGVLEALGDTWPCPLH